MERSRPEFIQTHVSLREHNSWKVGGTAEFYTRPKTKTELREVCLWAREQGLEISVLGQGTNILVADDGVPGLVVHMCEMNQILKTEIKDGRIKITCQPGVLKSDLLKIFIKNRLSPALFLAGLPGDVGGGVVMNAGIGQPEKPREFCEIVDTIEVLKINEKESPWVSAPADSLSWSYRRCQGWQPGIISEVTISWENKPDDALLKKVREGNQRRKRTQPLHLPSCGSVFKNPEGRHSGQLIEECGLKGFQIGGAQVSEKHANFIVNKGDATAQDIHAVIQYVQETVMEKFSIPLTNEVVYLGQWSS